MGGSALSGESARIPGGFPSRKAALTGLSLKKISGQQ